MRVPAKFWGEAVKTAVYLLNRAPTKSLDGKTPYEAWYGRKPSVKHLRTFGCTAFAKKLGPGVNKLADRSIPGVFLGYEPDAKGYRVYDPARDQLMVARDVIFDEKRPWNWEEQRSSVGDEVSAPNTFIVQYSDTVPGPTTDQDTGLDADFSGAPSPPVSAASIPPEGEMGGSPPHTPISSTASQPAHQMQWATPPSDASSGSDEAPRRFRTVSDLLDSTDIVENFEYSALCLTAVGEPSSVEEAMTKECWRQAMKAEMKAIEENRTWDVSDLPKGQKAIGLKWVFKLKKDPDGKVVKYKARLVAKGYAQVQGVDFEEVFAPVARIETVRVLLALAARGGWEVHHMDVKSAFLNGDLSESVFVKQPPGFIVGKGDKVLKLRKALYGLR
jgi:hypothetical protein